MNEDLMFDYLVQMGAMRPEEEQLKRKQAMVDYLRKSSMDAPQAQNLGRVVVAPSWTQALGQVAQGYAASRGQKDVDASMQGFNARQRQMLENMRNKKQGTYVPTPVQGGKRPEDDDMFGAAY